MDELGPVRTFGFRDCLVTTAVNWNLFSSSLRSSFSSVSITDCLTFDGIGTSMVLPMKWSQRPPPPLLKFEVDANWVGMIDSEEKTADLVTTGGF